MILNNGIEMPDLGLGTFLSKDIDCYNAVKEAIKVGYRHIDTANFYKNEEQVGKAIKDSNIDRKELFITTKIWPTSYGYEKTIKEFDETLKRLDLEYVDLLLMHWPKDNELNLDTWKAFEYLYENKKVRAIGVSNFQIHHLEYLLNNCKIKPACDQVEMHPLLAQFNLKKYLDSKNINMISFGPFAKGNVFDNEILIELSKKLNRPIANIVIKWGLERGIIMIPKSITKERIESNFNNDFELSGEDIEKINSINRGRRFYTDPDNNPF